MARLLLSHSLLPVIAACGVASILTLSPGTSLAQDMLPNLVVDPPAYPYVETDDEGERRALRFSVFVQNAGSHPLEITSALSPANPSTTIQRLPAAQCAEWQGLVCTRSRPAGTLRNSVSEPGPCYTYDGAMLYELRRLVGLQPDFSPSGVVRTSGMLSLAYRDDHRDPTSELTPPAYASCAGTRQGMSPSWRTVLDSEDLGQYLILDGLQGEFALVVTTNPLGLLAETTFEDNAAFVPILIQGDEVKVLSEEAQ